MEYVILDIETTGLDPEYSAIIEVGAVLVSKNKIQAEYSSFVRYEDEVPYNIKKLTGITTEMVKDAPPLSEVLKELGAFIGKRPVVSHNGFSFDFKMLARNGFPIEEKYDSMELAFFVLPTNPTGHSTKALSGYFELGDVPHRALEDCRLEFDIIKRLLKEYASRPKDQLSALKWTAERGGWWWAEMLPGKPESQGPISGLVQAHVPYRKRDATQTQMLLETKKIDTERVRALFSPTPEYLEERPEQRDMALTIADSLNNHTHCVIEAGTGVGKSKAYLVPSVLFALENQIPVIVSTFTKALQDQLFFKEIPHLCKITNKDLRVAVLKGKHNYVCLQKFDELAEETLQTLPTRSLYEFGHDEVKFTPRLAVVLLSSWILTTGRGDWDELPYWLVDRIHKNIEGDVCNSDELCTSGICDLFDAQKCFFAKAKLRAGDADLVIANHAVVLSGIIPTDGTEATTDDSDEAEQNGVQPNRTHAVFPNEARFLILDEAHHLEQAATSAWSEIVSAPGLQRLLQQMYGKKGVDKRLQTIAKNKANERLVGLATNFAGLEQDTKLAINNLFDDIIPAIMPPRGTSGWSEYLAFSTIEMTPDHAKVLKDSLSNIASRLRSMASILKAFADDEENPVLKKVLTIRARRALITADSIDIITDDGPAYVRYIERRGGIIEIKADLLSVAETLKEEVYDNFESVILTSATITIGQTFNFFDDRCGTNLVEAAKIKHRLLPSSFDYEKQVQFLVPEGIAYGSGEAVRLHYELSKNLIEEGVIAAGGGALILCSSHPQVESFYNDLVRPFAKSGLYLLRQIRGRSVGSVVREFAEDVHSVLVGTRSLWQGVDVPGPSLRALFIIKLPYDPPGNPVNEARKETYGGGWRGFSEYSEPLAVLALKQGFGRLIRKATDKGVVVMTDDRILRKRAFTTSFPKGVVVKRADKATILAALSALRPSGE
ncbi:hypothetical protein A2704_01420 [Candidatus Kaiserbacteria bacterium RIFCSPHIGHO2_01_FULL_54_36b]|uniref:Helicase ATP-binding domain-containing protein n=1 Tax=Candidatus Kaiserbacteria bacterium RIFCSPHIGHO2_01_FULL_54_36b TaxID=1798483 RepID=A0A1F6CI72_9BACT|nr:MAG: hypothetical protein A2704_01420 [Candidatus Kaiserbacteria bacterium RIFCSPHIGHO2_01_FULL_54_36b]